jgi:hypothetical protein
VAQEEADEAVFWLEFLVGSDAVPVGDVRPLLTEARELRSILVRSYTTARDRERASHGSHDRG